ncbi:tRNA (adenine(22)-N(1))-methyltransferase TrmK [Virgibacillus dakarensis]|uniref:tRNA (adenine(22)-N(1))-methyltransferase n=1 Tax=Virgibacillus dakarensis TaxID=1917889 RepID=UPI000B431B7B|nr:class I SAM-dependent methyltransferase [Virgibacillus dakarensis]MBT2214486.1 tRNA (adenine(22)-N(1))-methyltransferase TrmK [Virgibacillus dakarensis]
MAQQLTLSDRLKQVAFFLPEGAVFADIGSDHAYLPVFVCLQDNKAKAIAGEVNDGPYNSAKATVHAYQLTDRIDVRLGNGLEVIDSGEVKQLVIAGMGGALIHSILEDGKEKLEHMERIIAQPNVNAKGVRKWLVINNYRIVDEELIEENGHFYEIIVADNGGKDSSSLPKWTERELLFGPVLLTKQSHAFLKKWQYEHHKLTRIIKQMKHATIRNEEKIVQFEQELTWIEGVLHNV